MSQTIELGLDTFGDVTEGPDGKPLHAAQVIRNLVDEAVLAKVRALPHVVRASRLSF